jgi:aerobic-type carbon monoxide dehydrogenase small subunit (CoxS/CutS family)
VNKEMIKLRINGESYELAVAPNDLLLNVIRDNAHLTGTKYVCGIGECGACTVYVDGTLTLSCLTLAATVTGCEVTTIEGLAGTDGQLDPMQEAYLDHGAYQCGYCTPGLIMSSKVLLQENPSPTETEIQEFLRGNLCRCTGYTGIVRAVQAAAEQDA